MKTAEQWRVEGYQTEISLDQPILAREFIRKIQLEAMKEGMMRSADRLNLLISAGDYPQEYHATGLRLTASQLTEEDLK